MLATDTALDGYPCALPVPFSGIFGVSEPTQVYRPRKPQASPLFMLLQSHFESVKGEWEDRFESRYGYWRSFVDETVARYLDCGVLENGFARVFCDQCRFQFFVAFSCKTRDLCPSCAAKRAAVFASFLRDEVLEPVGLAQWVFTLPKMLRPTFLYRRELLGELPRLAWDTVRELMAAADQQHQPRPGMVAVVQSFGNTLRWNPHLHALVSRGGWSPDGLWVPVPYVDERAAELLFRHKVLKLLTEQGCLDQARLELLLSWKKNTGFGVHNTVTVHPEDGEGLERLARYLLRPPVSLSRLSFEGPKGRVRYQAKSADHRPVSTLFPQESAAETLDPLEFLARVIVHIPEPRKHLIRYYGNFSCRARAKRRQQLERHPQESHELASTASLAPSTQAASLKARRAWAQLIKRIYHSDPLLCPNCGSELRVIAFIVERCTILKILRHLETLAGAERGPPQVH
jgi:hypothetical protein